MVKVKEDLTGKRFNRLTVLERAEDYVNPNTGQHIARWKCQCDCGNHVIVRGTALKGNSTKSCGCLQKEAVQRTAYNNKKYNTYNLFNGYGIGYTSSGHEFYFDLEDYDLIKNYCWCCSHDGYIKTLQKNKWILMHRLVMKCKDGLYVDHINHDKSDNRKFNLRIVTSQENNRNKVILDRNTSGVTGVSYDKTRGLWRTYITVDKNKTMQLGRFKNFDDAVKVRKEAEEKYFGKYSYDNSMSKGDI